MLIAVLILSVVVLIEGYIIVEKEGRIIYLRKRLLRQIRMNDSMKMKLQTKVTMIPMDKQTEKEVVEKLRNLTTEPVVLNGHFEMPIEMTEVKNEEE